MFNLKEALGLTDDMYRDLKGGIFACVLTNVVSFLPFIVILGAINTLLTPLLDGGGLDTRRLWLLLGGGIASAVAYFFAYGNEYDKTYTVAYDATGRIRIDLAERMRRLPLSFFNKKDLTELTTNMMADCATIEHAMSHVAPGLVANGVVIPIVCVLLMFSDWRMALALLAALPVSFGLILLTRRISEKLGERHVSAKLEVAEQVQEYLEGIKVVKAFGLSGEKSKALEGAMRAMMREAIKFEGIAGACVTLGMMVLQVGIGLVTLVGVTLLTEGAVSVLNLFMFLIISSRLYAPLIVLMTLLPEFFYTLISLRRMRALRSEPVMTGDESVVLPDCNIELKDVTFAYGDHDVLRGVNLKIPQGGVTALVGPSGSGKTTVSRLIARFWDVQSGEITVGGKDVREIEPARLMTYMSFVFQDVVLFNDTVRNNIAIGRRDATDEEIRAAAKMARCDGFIRRMPHGYDTLLGENGSTLSGGERQRISIARALLKDAPIVLLDEATASLDPENETLIQSAISELVKGRTVIVIAHRLRTVMGADKIAVLDDGRLVEEGAGEALLAEDGLFARLYRIQQESFGWAVGSREAV
jgi:ATP-binding cassette subfamily B protein